MQSIPSHEEEEDDDHSNNTHKEGNKLKLWQGVALLTADCLGVGVLALPYDAHKLGWAFGISFLVANLPINFVAGNYLSIIALNLETSDTTPADSDNEEDSHDEVEMTTTRTTQTPRRSKSRPIGEDKTTTGETVHRRQAAKSYAGIPSTDNNVPAESMVDEDIFDDEDVMSDDTNNPPSPEEERERPRHGVLHSSKATYDLISISSQVFQSKNITRVVVLLYYTNLFLVLGDYILVMSRAVSAIFLDQICTPTAGAIASILMFAICQLKTMANIGRTVSLVSLLAMLIVLVQCLWHHRIESSAISEEEREEDENQSIWQKLSALASIAFAVGSQKLFLNIRHELEHREKASKTLAWSLTTYGTAYVIVIILAGPMISLTTHYLIVDPPSFLFDAIPEGLSRRVAGLLLWGHVAVSYAINSQALCSSIDRFIVSRLAIDSFVGTLDPTKRWLLLTLTVATSSYLVSNAIPFFKDLVALIGALTGVPLTLTLPVLLYRKAKKLRLSMVLGMRNCLSCSGSFGLLLFSIAFFVVGLIGAVSSIDQDWLNHGKPFSCH
eukprot:scaffold2844_cov123-Cylindrotheca_fusiformis.AAC.9